MKKKRFSETQIVSILHQQEAGNSVKDISRQHGISDGSLIEALHQLVEKHPTIGFWKCYYRLRRKGCDCNHKRLYRVYTLLGLNVRRKAKRRVPQRIKEPLSVPAAINQGWSMDFMCDSLVDGRRFRLLNIIDDHNRESLAIKIVTSLHALRVIRTLQRLIELRTKPQSIRVDNGPEFISNKLKQWCDDQQIRLQFIQPGKPVQNAFIERNNGSLRKELLDAYLFYSLSEVRIMAEEWRQDYNCQRPHQSLGFVPPVEFI